MLHAYESVSILIRQHTRCYMQMNLCAQTKEEVGQQKIDKTKNATICARELQTKLTGRRTHRPRSQIVWRGGDVKVEGSE